MKNNKVVILLGLFALLFFVLLSNAYSDSYRHGVVYKSDGVAPVTNIYNSETIVNNSSGIALAAASGQHHYKATTSLQWSAGGAYTDINDESAASFGLGKQFGKVFVSGNYGSDGHHSIVGVSASGTF